MRISDWSSDVCSSDLLSGAGVDALDPQGAEIALLGAAVAVGVLQALLDPLDGHGEDAVATAAIALGTLHHLLVAGVGSGAALCSCHVAAPLLRVDQEVASPDLGVGIAQHGGAPRVQAAESSVREEGGRTWRSRWWPEH